MYSTLVEDTNLAIVDLSSGRVTGWGTAQNESFPALAPDGSRVYFISRADPPFNQKYRAYFRLKTDNVLTTTEVAMLDVVVNAGSNVLGIKRLRGTDFRAANQYQEFYVDFYHDIDCNPNCLEFRVAYRATANLWLDRILVVSYPEPYAPTKQWILRPGPGLQRVIAKFIDGAGNISADSSAFVKFTPTLFIPALLRR